MFEEAIIILEHRIDRLLENLSGFDKKNGAEKNGAGYNFIT